MANEQAFFVDDELIERLLRGDAPVAGKPSRPSTSNALAEAIQLATSGKLDEAAKALEDAAQRGEEPAEVYSALGHVRFEQERWEDAAACYAKVTTLNTQHPT